MRRPRLSLRFLFVVLLLVAVNLLPIALPVSAQGDQGCTVANSSRVKCDSFNDCYCAGVADFGACSQCAATYEGGYTICTSDSTGRHTCIDYQN
jgi:hypothetical protein